MPATPWRPDELARVLAAVTDLAAALTPAPIAAPTFADRFAATFTGWRTLAATGAPDDLDPWVRETLRDLAALESGWEVAAAGSTLLHADLRADNLLLTADRVVVVDWPWASIGAPWIDLLAMLPSVAMQGGPPPWTVFDRHPVAAGADPAAVTAVLAALAGFFVYRGGLPAPPGLPTVRAFQAAQGRCAVDWLRTRLG
jgi:aminoglycoside phosphotransferase (APT) family kinase protein